MMLRAGVPARRDSRTLAGGLVARLFASRFGFWAPLLTYVQPARGAGAATFTRATVATVKDFEGNIRNVLSGEVRFEGQRRVYNYLAASARKSEDLTDAGWTKTSVTAVDADTANFTAASGELFASCSLSHAAASRTWLVRAKMRAGTASQIYLGLTDNVAWTAGRAAQSSAISLTADWRVYSFLATFDATAVGTAIVPVLGMQGHLGNPNLTTGTVDITEIQVEQVTGQSNQNPSEYVSVGAAKLNYLINTEAISSWASGGTLGEVINGQLGNAVAWDVTDDAAAAYEYKALTTTVPNDSATWYFGIRVKKTTGGTAGTFGVEAVLAGGVGVTSRMRLNTDTGAVAYGTAFTIADGGDYWEISSTIVNNASGNTSLTFYIYPAVSQYGAVADNVNGTGTQTVAAPYLRLSSGTYSPVGNVYPYHGACVDGVRYYDYQNSNSVASNVVTEGTTRTPCLGYTSGSWTNSAEGYLPEGASTNLVLQSSNFGATWTAVGTPTRSAAAAYCGDIALDLIGDDSAGGIEGYYQAITFTADASKSYSFLIKQGTSTSSTVQIWDNTALTARGLIAITWSNGVPVATASTGSVERAVEALGNGVYRVYGLATGVVAANVNRIYVYAATDAGGAIANTGDVYIGGVQAENATVASSLQPTTTATVARNADVLTWPGAGNVNQTTGTVYAEGQCPGLAGVNGTLVSLEDGTANERIQLLRGSGFGLRVYVADGGVNQADLTDGTINSDFFKAAARYAVNNFAASYGGRTPVADVAGTLPTTTTIYAGVGTGANYLGGPMKNLRIAKVALSNGELVAISR